MGACVWVRVCVCEWERGCEHRCVWHACECVFTSSESLEPVKKTTSNWLTRICDVGNPTINVLSLYSHNMDWACFSSCLHHIHPLHPQHHPWRYAQWCSLVGSILVFIPGGGGWGGHGGAPGQMCMMGGFYLNIKSPFNLVITVFNGKVNRLHQTYQDDEKQKL